MVSLLITTVAPWLRVVCVIAIFFIAVRNVESQSVSGNDYRDFADKTQAFIGNRLIDSDFAEGGELTAALLAANRAEALTHYLSKNSARVSQVASFERVRAAIWLQTIRPFLDPTHAVTSRCALHVLLPGNVNAERAKQTLIKSGMSQTSVMEVITALTSSANRTWGTCFDKPTASGQSLGATRPVRANFEAFITRYPQLASIVINPEFRQPALEASESLFIAKLLFQNVKPLESDRDVALGAGLYDPSSVSKNPREGMILWGLNLMFQADLQFDKRSGVSGGVFEDAELSAISGVNDRDAIVTQILQGPASIRRQVAAYRAALKALSMASFNAFADGALGNASYLEILTSFIRLNPVGASPLGSVSRVSVGAPIPFNSLRELAGPGGALFALFQETTAPVGTATPVPVATSVASNSSKLQGKAAVVQSRKLSASQTEYRLAGSEGDSNVLSVEVPTSGPIRILKGFTAEGLRGYPPEIIAALLRAHPGRGFSVTLSPHDEVKLINSFARNPIRPYLGNQLLSQAVSGPVDVQVKSDGAIVFTVVTPGATTFFSGVSAFTKDAWCMKWFKEKVVPRVASASSNRSAVRTGLFATSVAALMDQTQRRSVTREALEGALAPWALGPLYTIPDEFIPKLTSKSFNRKDLWLVILVGAREGDLSIAQAEDAYAVLKGGI